MARQGVEIDRSTLAFWVGYAAAEIAPVARRLKEIVLGSGRLFADETVVPVLDPGRGRTKQGYFWTIARDDRGWGGLHPPAVVYTYAPGRQHQYARALLGDFGWPFATRVPTHNIYGRQGTAASGGMIVTSAGSPGSAGGSSSCIGRHPSRDRELKITRPIFGWRSAGLGTRAKTEQDACRQEGSGRHRHFIRTRSREPRPARSSARS